MRAGQLSASVACVATLFCCVWPGEVSLARVVPCSDAVLCDRSGRRSAAQAEADRLAGREAALQADARQQADRQVELEKQTASLQLELRALSAKYEQESRALRELRQRRSANHQEATVELVKCESPSRQTGTEGRGENWSRRIGTGWH